MKSAAKQYRRFRTVPAAVALCAICVTLSLAAIPATAAIDCNKPADRSYDSATHSTKESETLAAAGQSVTKISSADAITIELNTQPCLTLTKNNPSQPATASTTGTPSPQQIGLLRIYRSNLLKKTYQHVVYPESAIDRNQQGDVVLKITIRRDGKIEQVDYHRRAEFNSLNKAATRAVYQARPFPAAPARLEGENFVIVMPIKFRLAS